MDSRRCKRNAGVELVKPVSGDGERPLAASSAIVATWDKMALLLLCFQLKIVRGRHTHSSCHLFFINILYSKCTVHLCQVTTTTRPEESPQA